MTKRTTATSLKPPLSPFPELNRAVQIVSDTLVDCEIMHLIEPVPDEPNAYLCTAFDGAFLNTGAICWSVETQTLGYIAFNDEEARRAKLEGIPEEDANEWWNAKDVDVFLLFLMGEVREIMAKVRANLVAADGAQAATEQ